ncbi:MAG: hypothetical protein F4X14_04215 [Caldilineaceae bacterium SB0661_bin_32]|uniref:Uncharacterized protein n=1 Tax=Caldilineaceae bacterium SB0661_bin_32 TaxID=2605255 RepID=A0A6B1D3N3_9CHLR|nr:hypothetical protein [Caldilineaceae bacterium SB0661_bin_32]
MISGAAAARMGKSLLALFCRAIPTSPQTVLSPSQARLLCALLSGGTLKSHRYLDGRKEYLLHPLHGEALQVPSQDVRRLEELDLLLSNHKFPSTTLLLSQRGRLAAAKEKKAAGAPPSPGDSAWNSGS